MDAAKQLMKSPREGPRELELGPSEDFTCWTPPVSPRLGYEALHQDLVKPSFLNVEEQDLEEREWKLAIARTSIGITMRAEGVCQVEESVYGAAMVMPQLARTSGWSKTLTISAIRSFMFLALNVFLQAYVLKMIAKEEGVMDLFSGQMNLCDFGANIEACPGPGCRGPGGTDISPPRLYNWAAIVNRGFVRDSLKALFPDRIQDIDEKVDVGEYGIESYWCRFTCCFIFMISCMGELVIIFKMCELLYQIPSKAEPWILAKPRTGAPLLGALDEVKLTIAGMPLGWKAINLITVVVPKAFLWKITTETGITFLMETASIENLIINSVALTFILSLDELIGAALMSEETLNCLRETEDFDLYDAKTSEVGDISLLTDDEILEKFMAAEHGASCLCFWDLVSLLPGKLFISVLATCFFIWLYYRKHCILDSEDGIHRLVSKTMYTPKDSSYSWLNAFFPSLSQPQYEDKPYWQMPHG